MKPMRPSFADHPFRWPPHARLDICGRGERPMAFMPENRFGAGGKRGLCWSRSQAGLAIQLLLGLGLRLRRQRSGRDGSSIFEHGSAHNGARFVRIAVRFVRIAVRFVRIPFVLSVNLGRSARIGEFGKGHHRVFRHSRIRIGAGALMALPLTMGYHLSIAGWMPRRGRNNE